MNQTKKQQKIRFNVLKTLKKIKNRLFSKEKSSANTPLIANNQSSVNTNQVAINIKHNPKQIVQNQGQSSTDGHFITAMTFNIGDANIKQLVSHAENIVSNKLINKNIFVKIFDKHFEERLDLPEILIIGLQEVPSARVNTIQQEFEAELNELQKTDSQETNKIVEKNYKFLELNDGKKYINVCRFNYNILTMVLVSNNIIDAHIQEDETITWCPKSITSKQLGTKGFTVIKLKYKLYSSDSVIEPPLYIVNLHAPFKSNEKTKQFFDELFKILSGIPYSVNNIIIMGDYNSRSLVSNLDEYIKDVPPELCENDISKNKSSKDNYCRVKENLEDLQFNNNDKLYGQIKAGSNNKLVLDNLVATNTFNKIIGDNPGSVYGLMKEYPITFLPTYKRRTQKQQTKRMRKSVSYYFNDDMSDDLLRDVGSFSLEKGTDDKKQFRLPGFADRIMVIGNRINRLSNGANMYSSIPVFGNDHIPVVSTFEIS